MERGKVTCYLCLRIYCNLGASFRKIRDYSTAFGNFYDNGYTGYDFKAETNKFS